MISYKHIRILIRIVAFGLLCTYFGFIFTLIEKGIIGDLDYYPATNNPYNFKNAVQITTIGSFILGIFFGIVEVFVFDKVFRKVSFFTKLLSKTFIYIFFISLFFNVVTLLNSSLTKGLSIFHPEVLDSSRLFFTNSLFFAVLFYAGGIIAVILFLFEINDNLGQGIVTNFIIGKYHKPRYENRIFLFIDLNSSVAIAEKLGNTTYFEFLKDYYAEMTDAIEKYYGKIYQYVGDEIVITWKSKKGLKHNNCLHCFFKIKEHFCKIGNVFKDKFGIAPEFKGAIHIGIVATGEIGVLKKEIFFSGDVLNTTSRMEGLCHKLDEDCLISENLINELAPDNKLSFKKINSQLLKGKSMDINLYAVSATF